MTKFKSLRYHIGSGDDRRRNLELVEQELQNMGYKSYEPWNTKQRVYKQSCYIVAYPDGIYALQTNVGIGEHKDHPIPNSPTPERVTEQPKPSKEAREFWEAAFVSYATDDDLLPHDCAELADEALAEWQKRFEA